jgi:glutathione S-transferase
MKLYDAGRAPNPRRVRVFLAEKGLRVPLVPVDLGKLEHKAPAFVAVNPLKQTPALELDDGTILTESIAICRYFEELHPEPPLFGVGPIGRATVEMWQRRLEFGLLGTVVAVFRHLHPAMKDMEFPQVAMWGETNKPKVMEFLSFLDAHLADRDFVCGGAYTVADITGLIALDFMKPAKLAVPESLRNVRLWYDRLAARPSALA